MRSRWPRGVHDHCQRSRVAVENKQYQKDVFPLYSSYQGGAGKEMRVDDRQNILKSPKVWVLAVLVVGAFSFGVYTIVGFFSGAKYKGQTAVSAKTETQPGKSSPSAQVAGAPPVPDVSDLWRITGTYQVGSSAYVVLVNDAGSVRVEHPSAFQGSGAAMVGQVDGQRVLHWSGVPVPQKGPQ